MQLASKVASNVLKSRRMPHPNQLREFRITGKGIQLLDGYVSPEGVLIGSARLAQESREKSAGLARQQETEAKQRALQRKRDALEAHILALRKEFDAEKEEAELLRSQELHCENVLTSNRVVRARSRHVDL
jgi:circadian clock protein KaiC